MAKNIILTLFFFGILLLVIGLVLYLKDNVEIKLKNQIQQEEAIVTPVPYMGIRSIDTMKYSRDLARENLNDQSFDKTIDKQMKDIAETGANYVAIGTPYDEEFIPILKRWVSSARKHNLHVWFRGNFSGWEEWFDYEKIDRTTHVIKTERFILDNPDIFEDGDIFTSCPECENGADLQLGDPASIIQHRSFLIVERSTAQNAFSEIGKKVEAGYYSMNGDAAKAVMDQETTKALGGIVAVDHYVATTEQLADDIKEFAHRSGGKVVLGEFGAPIPDIQGVITEDQQALWIDSALSSISGINELVGVNYWVNKGGSTALWNDDDTPRTAVSIIKKYYK